MRKCHIHPFALRRARSEGLVTALFLHAALKHPAERNQKVNETVLLDFRGQLAVIHKDCANGLVGSDAQARYLFLDLLLNGGVYPVATLDLDNINGLRRLNQQVNLQARTRCRLSPRIWCRRRHKLSAKPDLPAKRSTRVDLPIRRLPETTTSEADSFAHTDERILS